MLGARRGCLCCLLITKLLLVAVVVVNAYQRAAEGQYFAEGNEERVVDFTYRRGKKPRCQQCAPKSAHGSSDYELEFSHRVCDYFPQITLIYTEPRGSFIRQLRRTRSDRSNECEIRIWETIKINYLLGALSILSYLLSVLSSTYSAYPCKSVRSVGGNISYALRARNPNYPNQRHPFLVEIV